MTRLNIERDLDSFKTELDVIKNHGFNPIGVSQILWEDIYIFETQEETEKAYKTLECGENKHWTCPVEGMQYSKAKFLDVCIQHKKRYPELEVMVKITI